MKKPVAAFITVALLSACVSTPHSSDEWPTYHHDSAGTRFSPLKQITPANVAGLQQAWTYHMRPANAVPDRPPPEVGDAARMPQGRFSMSEATPLVVDGRMFVPTPYGRVVALDAANGKELWVYELTNRDQASTRGVEYWPGFEGA